MLGVRKTGRFRGRTAGVLDLPRVRQESRPRSIRRRSCWSCSFWPTTSARAASPACPLRGVSPPAPSEEVGMAIFGRWTQFTAETAFGRFARRQRPLFPTPPSRLQFNRLVRPHRAPIAAFVLRLGGDLPMADERTLDTFVGTSRISTVKTRPTIGTRRGDRWRRTRSRRRPSPGS